MPPKKNKACFSSTNHSWQTPPEELALVRRVNRIALDPCTVISNPVDAKLFYIEEDNGLTAPWHKAVRPTKGLIFVNPPYVTKFLILWIEKCIREAEQGAEIIFLGPSRTDQPWNNLLLNNCSAVNFPQRRIKFVGGQWRAPFPSVYGYWGNQASLFCEVFESGSHKLGLSRRIVSDAVLDPIRF